MKDLWQDRVNNEADKATDRLKKLSAKKVTNTVLTKVLRNQQGANSLNQKSVYEPSHVIVGTTVLFIHLFLKMILIVNIMSVLMRIGKVLVGELGGSLYFLFLVMGSYIFVIKV